MEYPVSDIQDYFEYILKNITKILIIFSENICKQN